ncbi:MAG: TolC family protein [Bacteroidota bacterium]
MFKPVFLLMVSLLLVQLLEAQPLKKLSLGEAYDLLEQRYPKIKDSEVLQDINLQELKKLDISRLPMIFLKADGRWQSEAVSLTSEGAPLPFEIDRPLVSATASLEIKYNILDGGYANAQRQLLHAQLKTQQQGLEVEKYQLRERINLLVLNTILIEAQLQSLVLSLEDLDNRRSRVAASVEEGSMLESEVSKIDVKKLELQSIQQDLQFNLRSLFEQLTFLTGKEISRETEFIFPDIPDPQLIPELRRPELEMFRLQREAVLAQTSLLNVHRRPSLGVYAQGGVGYPNPLNILDSDLAPYAVVGFQFNWKLLDWKQNKADQELLRLKTQQLNHAEETFTFNMEASERSYQVEVQRISTQIKQDRRIMELQSEILKQMAAQLDEGVITSSEYLTQVNAELGARQNMLIHQTQLLQTQINFLNERGAY